MLLRDASRTPLLMGLDAKWVLMVIPTLFFINIWTILYDLVVIIFFIVLKSKGIEIGFAYRRLRSKIRGPKVDSRPWWFLKKWRNR